MIDYINIAYVYIEHVNKAYKSEFSLTTLMDNICPKPWTLGWVNKFVTLKNSR